MFKRHKQKQCEATVVVDWATINDDTEAEIRLIGIEATAGRLIMPVVQKDGGTTALAGLCIFDTIDDVDLTVVEESFTGKHLDVVLTIRGTYTGPTF